MYVTKFVSSTAYAQSSVMSFANYLEKEGLLQEELSQSSSRQLSAYLDKQNDMVRVEGKEYFFNGKGGQYDSEQVTKAIDANVKGLKLTEARYYTFAISPSNEEIKHLRRIIADNRQVLVEAGEEIPVNFEDAIFRTYLKDYTVKCMDQYATNFNHPQINDNQDLCWFGMVEKDRYWKNGDAEVKKNKTIDKKIGKLEKKQMKSADPNIIKEIEKLKKQYIRESHVRANGSDQILRPMLPKTGDNWHIHISVSRRDITNSFNLSPNANGRTNSHYQLNGQSVRIGFDREQYKIGCEKIFDNNFRYTRLQTESYEIAKRLREESPAIFHQQKLKDLETRRAEAMEYIKFEAQGYRDYYESLLQCESLDARQLGKLKGELIREITRTNPDLSAKELFNYDLDELRAKLSEGANSDGFTTPNQVDQMAASMGDKLIHNIGLEGFNPISTTRKILKKGIGMNKAINRRQEVLDRWIQRYSDQWHQENFIADSITDRCNTEILLAQSENGSSKLGGSLIIENAQNYIKAWQGQVTAEFLATEWPVMEKDLIGNYAVELFGKDAAAIESVESFKAMAHERLLPMDAKQSIAKLEELKPKSFDQLKGVLPSVRTELTAKFETLSNQQHINQIQNILQNPELTMPQREEALLVFAKGKLDLDEKTKAILADFDKKLRNVRSGVISIVTKQNPTIKPNEFKELLNDILEKLKVIKIENQTAFSGVIKNFISEKIPDYSLVVTKQSQLEQLIKEITPDADHLSTRMAEANAFIQKSLPSERLFQEHGHSLFGKDVDIRTEHDLVNYVDKTFPKTQAEQYKGTVKNVFAKIEDKRRGLIQEYVKDKITPKEVEKVKHRQKYINRYIQQKFGPQQSKDLREELQKRVSSACKNKAIPAIKYNVFDHSAKAEVISKATEHAQKVKVLPITPQQIAIKVAIKLITALTKGY